MLEFIVGALTIVVVLVALLLIAVILIQPSSGGGLGAMSGGVTESVFGAGAGNILTKTTVILASIFLGLTLVLTVLSSRSGGDASIMDMAPEQPVLQEGSAPAPDAAEPAPDAAEPAPDAAEPAPDAAEPAEDQPSQEQQSVDPTPQP